MNLRKAALATALIATAAAGVAPAASHAATATPTLKTTYNIGVNRVMLSTGSTVPVAVQVSNPQANVKQWWSRSTVQNVVRQGVNGIYETPFYSQGYRCVPTIPGGAQGTTAHFTCKLNGADVPTTVKLTFTATYKQPISKQ